MDTIQAIRTRRSVRAFLDRPVDRALLAELIDDAAHAPYTPAAKDGPWRFHVALGRERMERYDARALEFAREHRPPGPGYDWIGKPGFSVFHGAPAAIVIAGRCDFPLALEECTRAAQLLEISARARGLGSCWVGSPMLWLHGPEGRAELRIDEGWQAFAAIAVGFPDEAALPPRAPLPPAPVEWID